MRRVRSLTLTVNTSDFVHLLDSVHITLLGLAVTEFQEQVNKKSSIKNFFISPQKKEWKLFNCFFGSWTEQSMSLCVYKYFL